MERIRQSQKQLVHAPFEFPESLECIYDNDNPDVMVVRVSWNCAATINQGVRNAAKGCSGIDYKLPEASKDTRCPGSVLPISEGRVVSQSQ
jgi:hypothetical protein